jgi:hypothetical protein
MPPMVTMITATIGPPEARAKPAQQRDRDDEQRQQQQAGKDAGKEQPADRLFGENRVDDKAGRGRNQDTQRAARSDDAGRELGVIVEAVHLGERHLAHGQGRRNGRARKRGEAAAADHRRRGEAAPNLPDDGVGGIVELAAHAGDRGDIAHQDEEGNDDKLGRGGEGERFRCKQAGRGLEIPERGDAKEPDHEHREGDRHPDDQENKERCQADQADNGIAHAGASSLRTSPMPAASSMARNSIPNAVNSAKAHNIH